MLTNPRDALRGQSKSPFDILGMVSYWYPNFVRIRLTVFEIFDSDLKTRVRDHSSNQNRHGSIRHLLLPINVP